MCLRARLIDGFPARYLSVQKDHNLQKFQRDPTLVLWKADPSAHICSLTMVKAGVSDFICPGCQARYKMVRAKSAARSRDLPLHCKVCKQPIAASDGEDVLKYFLISRP